MYRGRRCARWKARGKTFTVPLNRKRTRIVYKSENWWVGFEDAAGEWQEVPYQADDTNNANPKVTHNYLHYSILAPGVAEKRRASWWETLPDVGGASVEGIGQKLTCRRASPGGSESADVSGQMLMISAPCGSDPLSPPRV